MSADGEEKMAVDDNVREQDKYLPVANISRIMKRALPPNAKISKDAKEAVQECVSEYISFITSEASDKCQREKRKTINGEDLLWAMSTLGFQDSIETLKSYLQKHRECEGEKAVKNVNHDVVPETQYLQSSMPGFAIGMPPMQMNFQHPGTDVGHARQEAGAPRNQGYLPFQSEEQQ